MKKLATLCCCVLSLAATAQKKETASDYPKDYFRCPLSIPISLAGNFGECRMGHFHSGMDIKTNSDENMPVYAAADGYVARIKMQKDGYGHALYVVHPNGYTTLYAHLNNFMPELQAYLRKAQYKQETWETDISLTSDQFPVKKGQQIAWSGNTGGSTAPHLHFEIRNTKTEHPLNPELFGFVIDDKIAPKPVELAVYDMSHSIYEQSPQIQALHKKGIYYACSNDTLITDAEVTGLGLNVDDYMNGSDNTLALYTAAWYMDDSLQGSITLDNIGYEETRYMHAYADYKTKKNGGPWIQCLFQLPGNRLNHIYKNMNAEGGTFVITDRQLHDIKIVLTDALGNSSILRFYMRSVNKYSPLKCADMYKANKVNTFEDPNITFYLDETTLYDDICFQFEKTPDPTSFSDRYKIHHADVPIHHNFALNIKPTKPVPFEMRSKIALVCNDGKTEEGKAAKNDDKGWYTTNIRSFGEYRLVADTVAPVIKPLQKTNNLSKTAIISFTVKDAITSVKKFRGTIDGKWVCFEQHGDNFFYKFDEHCPRGKHELVFTATDENNNTQTLHYSFTR
jgi:hypothetical protein